MKGTRLRLGQEWCPGRWYQRDRLRISKPRRIRSGTAGLRLDEIAGLRARQIGRIDWNSNLSIVPGMSVKSHYPCPGDPPPITE